MTDGKVVHLGVLNVLSQVSLELRDDGTALLSVMDGVRSVELDEEEVERLWQALRRVRHARLEKGGKWRRK